MKNNALFQVLQNYYDYIKSHDHVYIPWQYRNSNTTPNMDAAEALGLQLESEDYYGEELLAFGTNYALAKYYDDPVLIELSETIAEIATKHSRENNSHHCPIWKMALTRSLTYIRNDDIQKGLAICRMEYPDELTVKEAFHSDRLHAHHTLLARNVAAQRFLQTPTQDSRARLVKLLDISNDICTDYTWVHKSVQLQSINTEWLKTANELVLHGIPNDTLQIPKLQDLNDYPRSCLQYIKNLFPLRDITEKAPDLMLREPLKTYIGIHGTEKAIIAHLLASIKNYPDAENFYFAMAIHDAYPEETNNEGSVVQSVLRYILSTYDKSYKDTDAAMRNVFCEHTLINPWSPQYREFKKIYGDKPIVNPLVKTALALGSIQEILNILETTQVQLFNLPDFQEPP